MQAAYDDDTEIVLGYGAYHKKSGFLNKIIVGKHFIPAMQYLSYACRVPYMGVGRNLSYKKAVFFRHKGFSVRTTIFPVVMMICSSIRQPQRKIPRSISIRQFYPERAPATNMGINGWHKKNRHYTTHQNIISLSINSCWDSMPSHISFLSRHSSPACIIYNGTTLGLIFSVAVDLYRLLFITKSMKKLGEKDLFPFFMFFEVWMFFYYIIFAPALLRKPSQPGNDFVYNNAYNYFNFTEWNHTKNIFLILPLNRNNSLLH